MKDLEIRLENIPGTLSLLGETLGNNKISLEGGGVFYNGAYSIAHFLVSEPERAKEVLELVNIKVLKISDVIIQKLRQDIQYSDHANQLILVVDDYEEATKISAEWMKEWWS